MELKDKVMELINMISAIIQFKKVDIDDIMESIEVLLDIIKITFEEKIIEEEFYETLKEDLEEDGN